MAKKDEFRRPDFKDEADRNQERLRIEGDPIEAFRKFLSKKPPSAGEAPDASRQEAEEKDKKPKEKSD